ERLCVSTHARRNHEVHFLQRHRPDRPARASCSRVLDLKSLARGKLMMSSNMSDRLGRNMIDWSLILPSRERPEKLTALLLSISEMTDLVSVEVLVAIDRDDAPT